MSKKKSWKEETGLKAGDIAICKGSIRYKNKRYEINEEVIISEIKSNACSCIVKSLNEEKNIEVSILKKFLSNPNSVSKVEKNSDIETEDIVYLKTNQDNNQPVDKESKIHINDNNINTATDAVDAALNIIKNEINEDQDDLDITDAEPFEDENNSSYANINKNTIEQSTEKFDEKQVSKNIEAFADKIIEKEIKIPNAGFKNYQISSQLRDLIFNYTMLNKNLIITDLTKTKSLFTYNSILDLKEMYLHVPINMNVFRPKMCFKLVTNIDYVTVYELEKYINKNVIGVELEIYINQETNDLERYQFKTVNKYGLKTFINLTLNENQEKDIERYGNKCVKYYKKLVAEEK